MYYPINLLKGDLLMCMESKKWKLAPRIQMDLQLMLGIKLECRWNGIPAKEDPQ